MQRCIQRYVLCIENDEDIARYIAFLSKQHKLISSSGCNGYSKI